MAINARSDPYLAFNFSVEIDGLQVAGFTEVSGLRVKIESIPYHEGGGGSAVRQLMGAARYGNVTLSRGVTESAVLWNWMMEAAEGNVVPRQVSIILRKTDPREKETRWTLRNAWPTEWQGASLDAMGKKVTIEKFVVVFEGLKRESPEGLERESPDVS